MQKSTNIVLLCLAGVLMSAVTITASTARERVHASRGMARYHDANLRHRAVTRVGAFESADPRRGEAWIAPSFDVDAYASYVYYDRLSGNDPSCYGDYEGDASFWCTRGFGSYNRHWR